MLLSSGDVALPMVSPNKIQQCCRLPLVKELIFSPLVCLLQVLLLMHPYVVARMRNKVLLVTTSFVGASLLPGMGRLWLYPGSFCANHYYFTQLTYCLSTLILVSEFLNAALLRDREIDEKVANAKKAAKQTGNEDENVEKDGGEDVDEKKKEQ
jgi:hypothetical protein